MLNNKESLVLFQKNGRFNCFYIHKDGSKENIQINIVSYASDFNKRNKGIIDESVLQKRTVTIIGLGSGGSLTAIGLVRSGVTNLILIDFDIVSVSNLSRSAYTLADVGRKKICALFEKLIAINPYVNIRAYDKDILKMSYKEKMEIVAKSDLIIEATDNPKTKISINGLAHNTTPIIFPSLYEEGKGGDLIFTFPSLPCYECIIEPDSDENNDENKRVWDYTADKPKAMPGLLADISMVVFRSIKLALAILTADQENSLFGKITEPGCTMLLIGNEKNYYIFDRPFQEVWAETSIKEKCTCQTLC